MAPVVWPGSCFLIIGPKILPKPLGRMSIRWVRLDVPGSVPGLTSKFTSTSIILSVKEFVSARPAS